MKIIQKSSDRETGARCQRGGLALWLRWVLATALGELVGFDVPAVVGSAMAWATERIGSTFSDIGMVGAMILAGTVEGGVLGFAQWLVLRRYIQNMARREWVLATALAAGLAWALGMTPSTVGDITTLKPAVLVAGAILLGVVLVSSIGFAQWLVLRRYMQKATWWVAANAIPWPIGVAVPFGSLAMVPEGSPAAVWAVVGAASGVLMGAVVGAITGIALLWLLGAGFSPANKLSNRNAQLGPCQESQRRRGRVIFT